MVPCPLGLAAILILERMSRLILLLALMLGLPISARAAREFAATPISLAD